MKKYLVFPGFVTSKNDGERHFIGFARLCHFYGVRRTECIDATDHPSTRAGIDTSKLIELHPRADGNYTLPTA